MDAWAPARPEFGFTTPAPDQANELADGRWMTDNAEGVTFQEAGRLRGPSGHLGMHVFSKAVGNGYRLKG